ncbi:toxin regulator [Neobacillus sp. KR4-4]|uniref:toxin regulator n=1 Tax=Neobacillus sp. KR4-4 TaxID=3344872 RepID=UPI0035C9FC00
MKVLGFLKKRWKYVLTAIIALVIGASGGPSQDALDKANSKIDTLKKQLSAKTKTVANLKADNKDLQVKVEEAAPFFKLKEEDRKKKEAEAKAVEEKRLAEEKRKEEVARKEAKKKAAEEKKKQEAKEKQGYNTGITYNQLARTPDKYVDEKVKFRGTVIQVIEGDGETQIRLAVNDNYDRVLFDAFDDSVVSSRVLENDTITIYGKSTGLISYDSTLGGKISIPGISIDKIDQ